MSSDQTLTLPSMGVGAWSWGDRFYWGYGRKFGRRDVGEAFHISLEAGLDFFDTAEAYGQGSSEIILGELEREAGARLIIASKFMPFPWRLRKQDLLSALRRSLRRLGRDRLELYQIHWPLPPVPIETWMEGMADALRVGLVSAVGVSNYNLGQMQRAVSTLHRFGIPLRSNQVLYSLMDREPERSGLLEACQRQGIALIAYSPLAQGLLTGKYSLNAPPPLHRRMRAGRARLARAEAIVNVMRNIGEGYGGKSPSQVALNWVIRKGAIPIPGAKDGKQAEDNLGALGWQLSDEDVQQLDRASAGY